MEISDFFITVEQGTGGVNVSVLPQEHRRRTATAMQVMLRSGSGVGVRKGITAFNVEVVEVEEETAVRCGVGRGKIRRRWCQNRSFYTTYDLFCDFIV